MNINNYLKSFITTLTFSMLATISPKIWAQESITWFVYDFPPVAMTENGKPGNGFVDDVLKLVIEHWPEVEHRFVSGNAARFWAEIVNGKPLCSTTLRNTEREQFIYFRPLYLLPPPQLLARRELIAKLPLNASGEVRLSELFQQPLKGLLVSDRSYGSAINTLIANRPSEVNVEWLSAKNLDSNAQKMVAYGRGDWTIEFDFVSAYQRSLDPSLGDIVAIPIEGASRPLEGGFACPRTPWGHAMITRIDSIVSDPTIIAAAQTGSARWQTEESRRRYRKDIDSFYRQLGRATKDVPKTP